MLSTTWTTFTVALGVGTMAGKTFGSNGDDHFRLEFYASVGSGYVNSAPGLGVQSQTVQIRNVQLEIGALASRFEPRPLAVEEALCRRYYQWIGRGMVMAARDATTCALVAQYPTPMRTVPSVAVLSPLAVSLNGSLQTPSPQTLTPVVVDRWGLQGVVGGFSGLPVGALGTCNNNDVIGLDAEL